MHPIICIADLHFTAKRPRYRVDDYIVAELRKFDFILETAKQHGAYIVCAGDLFDKSYGQFGLLNSIMLRLIESGNLFLTVAGQHDQSYQSPDLQKTQLGALIIAKAAYHIQGKLSLMYGTNLYGRSWNEPYPKPSGAGTHILVAHATVTKEIPPPWLTAQSAEDMIESHPGFDYIITGDFHDKFVVTHKGCTLINTGPMMRSSIDKANFQPACWLVSDAGVAEILIPIEDDVFDSTISEETASENTELQLKIDAFLESLGFTNEKLSFTQLVHNGLQTIAEDNPRLKSTIEEIMEYVEQN